MRTLRIGFVLTVFVAGVGIPAAARADNSSPRWRLSHSILPVPLFRSIVLKLDDHRVMVIGGGSDRTGGDDNRRVFVYDVDTHLFDEVASLPAAKTATDVEGVSQSMTVAMGAGVLADGSVVVAGGQVDYRDAILNAHNVLSYRYFPDENRWVRTGDLPEPQALFAIPATLLDDGRLLVPGAYGPVAARRAGRESRKAFVYDPDVTTTVEQVDPATGETTGQTQHVTGAWDYTRTAGGAVSIMSQPHFYGNAVKLGDGRVVVAGGHTSWGDTSVLGTHTDFYDPTTGVWSRGPDLPAVPGEDDQLPDAHGGRANGICMAVVPDGAVVIAGGAANSDGTDFFGSTYYTRSSILTLNPAPNAADSTIQVESTTIPSAATGRPNGRVFGDLGRAHVSCYLTGDGRVLFAGGQNTDEDLYDTYFYDPTSGTTRRGPDLPHALSRSAASDPGLGYPPGYQSPRMGMISVAMRVSQLVFHGGTTFVSLSGYNATAATGFYGFRHAEQLDL